MQLRVEIRRLNDLVRAFQMAPAETKNELRLALKVALRDIQRSARRFHRFTTRSGDTERSVKTEVLQDWPPKGRVVLDPAVTMTKDGRSYAQIIHDGAPGPWKIRPRDKKVLRWAGRGGKFVFAREVTHPGLDPDPFVYNAGERERANVNAVFNRHTEKALRKAGL